MSWMGEILGVLFYVMLSFVFIVSFTSICYELSPYSRMDARSSLPEWERKTLYTVAGYPPLSLLLLVILAFMLPGDATPSLDGQVHIITWFCIWHAVLSGIGAAGAMYLRKRNRRNTVYFVTDLAAGSIYFSLLMLIAFIYN